VRGSGADETAAIQEIVGAGALKLKSDMLENKNSLLSSHLEYLRDEIEHFAGEIARLEKLRAEYETDAGYINNRLDKLNAENRDLESLIKREDSAMRKEKPDGNKL